MAYTFDQIFAVDEANTSNVAKDTSVLIFAPGDTTKTPLTLTTTDGQALANPIGVNSAGFGPAFIHDTLDRVAWEGAGYTGFFTSYEGIKDEAVAARSAADTAATNAANSATSAADSAASAEASANLVNAPADSAVQTLVNDPASATRGALNTNYASQITAIGGDETARLNAWLASASPVGVKRMVGAFSISGTLTVLADTNLDGTGASLTQTTALTPSMAVNSGATVTGLTINGVGTDYTNASTVYAAAGFQIVNNSTNTTLRHCKVNNMAGAGVYTAQSISKLRIIDCHLAGAGSPTVPASAQWSGGLVINNSGASDITVQGGSITGFAQGIVTGDLTDIRIIGVRIYDIPGQHGVYLSSASRYVISNCLIDNMGLEGIKIQIGTTTSPDAAGGTISGNTITRGGSHGIHLANTAGGTPRHRSVTISGNTITPDTGAGDGINLEYTEDATLTGNRVSSVRNGIIATSCSGLTVTGNRVNGGTDRGIALISTTDSDLIGNRVRNVATANGTSTEFGIQIDGATAADIRLSNNIVTESGTNMRYALYVGPNATAANQGTMHFLNNVLTGATDYGARMVSGGTTARWAGNTLGGTTGPILTPPTNYATNPNTSGATLAALETEVNELKATLRTQGVIAP